MVAIALLFAGNVLFAQSPDQKLIAMGIALPAITQPKHSYMSATSSGELVYFSGKGAVDANNNFITGKFGENLSAHQGNKLAQQIAIAFLAEIKDALGSLSNVKKIVKVSGYLNASPEFTDHSLVMDGFSDFMVKIFGQQGTHARTSVGVSSLPGEMALEIEMIVETIN